MFVSGGQLGVLVFGESKGLVIRVFMVVGKLKRHHHERQL
jgi:hypothetical protein